MGKDKNEEMERNPQKRRFKRTNTGVADWASVDGKVVINAITAASLAGGAIRFGYSRDGGAYALGIYGDGEPYTEYVAPGQSVEAVLQDITEAFAR